MTTQELRQILQAANVRSDAYQLNGGLPNEAYCLGCNDLRWEVYYSEKGLKSSLRQLLTENEACFYFLDFIKTDRRLFPALTV